MEYLTPSRFLEFQDNFRGHAYNLLLIIGIIMLSIISHMKKGIKGKEGLKIAENFKRFKKEKKLSKSQLVRLTGLDYHTLAKIERGSTPDPRIHTVLKIANAFNKTVDELVA